MFLCFLFGGTEDMFPWSRWGKKNWTFGERLNFVEEIKSKILR